MKENMAFQLENISFHLMKLFFFLETSEKKMQEPESILAWQMISCNSAAVLPRVFALASQESSCRLNSGPTMHASLSAFCFFFSPIVTWAWFPCCVPPTALHTATDSLQRGCLCLERPIQPGWEKEYNRLKMNALRTQTAAVWALISEWVCGYVQLIVVLNVVYTGLFVDWF